MCIFTLMEQTKKGCVYFFRHIGLTPVKIGYSENESPINRFNQFKTYAPYGSEILGFIQTDSAKKIETYLHRKFASKRLKGEWFDITENEVIKEVDFYTSIEDVYDRNEFQKSWAMELVNRKLKIENVKNEIKIPLLKSSKKEQFLEMLKHNPLLNKKQTAINLGVSRKILYDWIDQEK